MNTERYEQDSVEEKLANISSFVNQIKSAASLEQKLKIVNSQPPVNIFLAHASTLHALLPGLKPEHEFIVKVLIALGQGPLFFAHIDHVDNTLATMQSLLDNLLVVDTFYSFMGGLAGYYHKVLTLIVEKQKELPPLFDAKFCRPSGIDLSCDLAQRNPFRWGIESLPFLGHLLPIGGAGERLNLLDATSGEPLPVAFLPFGGKSLLEGIVMDLQAIEFVYWKMRARQLTIPIALMTSHEKNNNAHIQAFFKKMSHFGRKKESIRQFLQPLVPVITAEGDFALSSPLHPLLKPGGHGVIWKLAIESNIFTWFESQGISKLLVRQINNPIAGTDGGIWSFAGIGKHYQKKFGFLSCDRLVKASEGMLILEKTSEDNQLNYCLKNIEYTDFAAKGLSDTPKEKNSPYSAFPANTNILFADIQALKEIAAKAPVPGIMINMKNKYKHLDARGVLRESHGGRLESMMQNITDSIVDTIPKNSNNNLQADLRSFVVYGKRQKVISVTKSNYSPAKPISETPVGCFYDQMCNAYDLFKNYCTLHLPPLQTPEAFAQDSPDYIIRYHPALGPFYQVIAQKIRGGMLAAHSELQLDIAELDIVNLSLDGSLHITALDPLGHKDPEGILRYSNNNGKCELNNVTIVNQGINRKAENVYWKNEIARHEQLEIILHGNAEFSASNVVLNGGMRFDIPCGHRMEISMLDGEMHCRTFEILPPTWHWQYAFDEQNGIKLIKSVNEISSLLTAKESLAEKDKYSSF